MYYKSNIDIVLIPTTVMDVYWSRNVHSCRKFKYQLFH